MKSHTYWHKILVFRTLPLYFIFCSSLSACSQKHEKAAGLKQEKAHQHEVIQANVNAEDAEVTQLKTEVLTPHDEAMAHMDVIMELRHKAKTRLHTLQIFQESTHTPIDSGEKLKEEKTQLGLMIKELNQAYQLMMVWMRKYDAKMEKMSTDEKIVYLKKEKDSIGQVKNKMIETVDRCKLSLN